MERRIFGQPPQTVELALANLPDIDHSLLGEDEMFQHLNALRRIIEPSILHYALEVQFPPRIFPWSDIEEKMVPLTRGDVNLMEKLSFQREKLVGVLPFLPPETEGKEVWGTFFSPRNNQPWINVWEMSPWALREFPLVLIEEHEPEDPEFPFTMGVVTPAEYASLFWDHTLNIHDREQLREISNPT